MPVNSTCCACDVASSSGFTLGSRLWQRIQVVAPNFALEAKACRWIIMIPATLDQMPARPISPLGCESANLGANGILATDNFHGLP